MAQNWNKLKIEVFSPKPAHNPPKSSNDINVIWKKRYLFHGGKFIELETETSSVPDGWRPKPK